MVVWLHWEKIEEGLVVWEERGSLVVLREVRLNWGRKERFSCLERG